MRSTILSIMLALFLLPSCQEPQQVVTTGSLLKEMRDLSRLASYDGESYRSVQYSSYDRRSTRPGDRTWFANDDGFGGEPIPGFEKVLKFPDTTGIGEYLICDIRQAGAILRLWSAGIKGKIRFFLDDMDYPVYEGTAEDFFWKTVEVLSGGKVSMDSLKAFRQYDAVYFPIPFAEGCRIEWIGNIQDLHFYHVGLRLYEKDVPVVTFSQTDLITFAAELEKTNRVLVNGPEPATKRGSEYHVPWMLVPAQASREIFSLEQGADIERISLKIKAEDHEEVLRKCLLRIYFDGADRPQVESPVGDFFGAAPGLNPYRSFPFEVGTDSSMTCRFLMPFKNAVLIALDNRSAEMIEITADIVTVEHSWKDAKTMHFYSRWQIENEMTATNIGDMSAVIRDVPYLHVNGQGRIVGAAAFIYNPSNVPTSWGNWWGEGDEKIFIDRDSFPSFFGTGSEDYFNYSWSSSRLFSYPYCGQPRNDGPGNRGNVVNFRWHIIDDIPFHEKVSFAMELGHHGTVPGFVYGRIVYFYALPELVEDHPRISDEDLGGIAYRTWSPEPYKGSAGFQFIQAETVMGRQPNMLIEAGNKWANGSLVMWRPVHKGESISLFIPLKQTLPSTRIGFTLSHGPQGGLVSLQVNGRSIEVNGNRTIDLFEPNLQILRNHFSEPLPLNRGTNEITFIYQGSEINRTIGIDFIWLTEKAIIL
jgi:hypothetical protein